MIRIKPGFVYAIVPIRPLTSQFASFIFKLKLTFFAVESHGRIPLYSFQESEFLI